MPRPGLRFRRARGLRAARALALLSALVAAWTGGGCAQRSCVETEADLEPLAGALAERRRSSVAGVYYGLAELRGRVVHLEAYAYGAGPAQTYADPSWRGSAPRLLVRAGAEPGTERLELAAPGWTLRELEEARGAQLLLVVYVAPSAAPPAAGAPALAGRVLYICR